MSYGLLVHYTTQEVLLAIFDYGAIGPGCWLTPAAYAACLMPYDLGLDSPRDACLLIDVSTIPRLWGPGTAARSQRYPWQWSGGGIEFYCQDSIPVDRVRRVLPVAPCGDRLR